MRKSLKLNTIWLCILCLVLMLVGCKTNDTDHTLSTAESSSITQSAVDNITNDDVTLNKNGTPLSYFLADINYLNVTETIDMLRMADAHIITVPLSWNFLEPEEGLWTPNVYSDILDIFEKEGFSFIFVVDAGNRPIVDEEGKVVGRSIPNWVYEKEDFEVMSDFTGAKIGRGSMSYVSESTQQYYLNYCTKVIDYFGTRYKSNTVGFAPGIMTEFEIKYPQENFAWNDYSANALLHFQEYLCNKYSTAEQMNSKLGSDYRAFEDVEFPIINYNNTFASGALSDDPLYVDFQIFRSTMLEEFLKPVYELIHAKGFTTVSYFAQVLHPHDGIYNSGMAMNLSEYVDIAVIDYNFYDGYTLIFDTVLPAMMTNYLKSAGYQNVWSGIYVERMDFRDYYNEIQETITYCAQSGVCDGFEIGGVVSTLNRDSTAKIPRFSVDLQQRCEPAKVAIYVSEWNFYHSHGEQPEYINYFTDCITQMYKIVQFQLGINVDIISDSTVLSDKLERYDLIIAPGAFFVDENVKTAIKEYVKNGGSFLQDFRFGEWDAHCNNTGDWLDSLYSLTNREGLALPSVSLNPVYEGLISLGCIEFESSYPMIANVYSIAASNAESYLYQTADGYMVGIQGDNSICLGFQPQIQYKFADDAQEKQQYVEIVNWAICELMAD